MNENLNLVEILKDCPTGTKLYSPLFGDVELVWVSQFEHIKLSIGIKASNNATCRFTKDGRVFPDFNGECMLFPSKEQRDWSEFTAPWYKKDKLVEPKFKVGDWIITPTNKVFQITSIEGTSYRFNNKSHYWAICYCDEECRLWTIEDAKDGDVLEFEDHGRLVTGIVSFVNKTGKVGISCLLECNKFNVGVFYNLDTVKPHPATKEQRDALMKAMNNAGYKWNAETKTLEKLFQPKFKIGDRIRHKEINKDAVYEISKVYDDSYGIAGFTWMIYMKYQDQYELVPNKFDPKTLKPFDKVLARDEENEYWWCTFFSRIRDEEGIRYKYVTTSTSYKYCVPYNDDTKHLVGTADEAPEYYRYWED